MNTKTVFRDLTMEITVKTGFVARYYDELMYIIYDAQKYKVEVALQLLFDDQPIAFSYINKPIVS